MLANSFFPNYSIGRVLWRFPLWKCRTNTLKKAFALDILPVDSVPFSAKDSIGYHLIIQVFFLSKEPVSCYAVHIRSIQQTDFTKYSANTSLHGHSLQRSPHLIWPQINATATVNAVRSPSHQRPHL